MGLLGIILGTSLATIFLAIVQNVLIALMDWKELIKDATERVEKEKGLVEVPEKEQS